MRPKVSAACGRTGSIPLTPALSPWEREPDELPLESEATRWADGAQRALMLPLPWGEGWGEGERSSLPPGSSKFSSTELSLYGIAAKP